MEGKSLQRCAAERTQELPGAEVAHPFGPDWDVFTVRSRVFMLQADLTGDPLVILKASPADGEALQQAHEEITPRHHMNKWPVDPQTFGQRTP